MFLGETLTTKMLLMLPLWKGSYVCVHVNVWWEAIIKAHWVLIGRKVLHECRSFTIQMLHKHHSQDLFSSNCIIMRIHPMHRPQNRLHCGLQIPESSSVTFPDNHHFLKCFESSTHCMFFPPFLWIVHLYKWPLLMSFTALMHRDKVGLAAAAAVCLIYLA